MVDPAVANVATLSRTVIGDVTQTIKSMKSEGWERGDKQLPPVIQYRARQLIREVFASIEAVIFILKSTLPEMFKIHGIKITEAEADYAIDVESKLTDKGIVVKKLAKIRTLENILFAFSLAERIEGVPKFEKDVWWWKRLVSALAVRDRLMHPKKASDLEILPHELDDAERAFFGFLEHFSNFPGGTIAGDESPQNQAE